MKVSTLAKLVLATGAVHFATIAPSLRRNANSYGPICRSFRPSRGDEVWLTIDDGACALDTEDFLQTLARHESPATFFLIGRKVEARRDLARAIACAGHQIGHHSHTHPAWRFWAYDRCGVERELDQAIHAYRSAGLAAPAYFRAPAGLVNRSLAKALPGKGLSLIGWSASARDGTAGFDPGAALARVKKRLRPGCILVLHQGKPAGRANLLNQVLCVIKESGLRCVLPEAESLIFE